MPKQSITQTSRRKEVEIDDIDEHYVYTDYSRATNEENNKDTSIPSNPSPAFIRVQKLTIKLNAMLSNPELSNIITWMPHGRSWMILKPKNFVSTVMPYYFESANYNSFLRLVNAWGFRRITTGPDKGSFFHEFFLRGMPQLHARMHRLSSTHKKLPMWPEDEPNFLEISSHCPLPEATPVKLNLSTTTNNHFPNNAASDTRANYEQEITQISAANHLSLSDATNRSEPAMSHFGGRIERGMDPRLLLSSHQSIVYNPTSDARTNHEQEMAQIRTAQHLSLNNVTNVNPLSEAATAHFGGRIEHGVDPRLLPNSHPTIVYNPASETRTNHEQEIAHTSTANHLSSSGATNVNPRSEPSTANFGGRAEHGVDPRLLPYSRPSIGYATPPQFFYLFKR